MDEIVYLFCSRKQYANWIADNCGNCLSQSAGFPGCDLSAAVTEALSLEGVVPLRLAERIGYFDAGDPGRPESPGTWTCRGFRTKDDPAARPAVAGG